MDFQLHPDKSDDWKWSTDKRAFIIKWLLKKSIPNLRHGQTSALNAEQPASDCTPSLPLGATKNQ